FSFAPRAPLLSTLFPYTTLFRSQRSSNTVVLPPPGAGKRLPMPSMEMNLSVMGAASFRKRHQPRQPGQHLIEQHADHADHQDRRDRKSTRLNSSHQIISYAVFCL